MKLLIISFSKTFLEKKKTMMTQKDFTSKGQIIINSHNERIKIKIDFV